LAKRRSNSKQVRRILRTVDLGREEELVTWDEWFGRSLTAMKEAVPKKHHGRLAFRVSLADGRMFSVKQILAHVAHGACTLGPSRWSDSEAVCNVITGYMFLGVDESETPSTLCVSPATITSVECVLVGDDEEDSPRTPFGFYKREGLDAAVERKEVEEKLTFANAEGSD
jgi:hypothetical protein